MAVHTRHDELEGEDGGEEGQGQENLRQLSADFEHNLHINRSNRALNFLIQLKWQNDLLKYG